jgi:flagellar biosynthesis protein FlhF
MQIHRVKGSSLKDALNRARHLHGEDAVVIRQEPTTDGGITLAVTKRASATTPPLLDEQGASRVSPRDPLLNELATRLRRNGASDAFVARVLTDVAAKRGSGAHILDIAAEEIGARFVVAKLPRARGKARVLALAGAAGVGKSTTIAKLALRLVRANRQVDVVTLDSDRPGAVEQMRAWTDFLGVPFDVARNGVEPRSSAIATADLVLVDTSGRRERDVDRLVRMRRACREAGADLETYLCLPASASRSALQATIDAYAPLRPSAAVITKLDETSEPCTVLERVLDTGLAVAFLNGGPDVHGDLQRATREAIGDLCLRGRLA